MPITGGTPVRLNSNLPVRGNVPYLKISADIQRVIYTADQITDNASELASVNLDGSNLTRLNPNLPFNAFVKSSFQTSPDGVFVVYIADQNVFDENELFAHQLKESSVSSEADFCLPIRPNNGNIVVICL